MQRYSNILRDAAFRCFAGATAGGPEMMQSANIKLPGRQCTVSVYSAGEVPDFQARASEEAKLIADEDGTPVFKRAIVRGNWLCLFVSDELLEKYAAVCAALPQQNIWERICVPQAGVAPDISCSQFASARLRTFARRPAGELTPKAADALSRCFLLFATEESDMVDALAAATRAALELLRDECVGGAHALAMANALDAASASIAQKEYKGDSL